MSEEGWHSRDWGIQNQMHSGKITAMHPPRKCSQNLVKPCSFGDSSITEMPRWSWDPNHVPSRKLKTLIDLRNAAKTLWNLAICEVRGSHTYWDLRILESHGIRKCDNDAPTTEMLPKPYKTLLFWRSEDQGDPEKLWESEWHAIPEIQTLDDISIAAKTL